MLSQHYAAAHREEIISELDRMAKAEFFRLLRSGKWISLIRHVRAETRRKVGEASTESRERHTLVSVLAPLDVEEYARLTDSQVSWRMCLSGVDVDDRYYATMSATNMS